VLQDKLIYSITGDALAQQYFYINPTTGVVTLKKLLTEDDSPEYNVRHSLYQSRHLWYNMTLVM